MLPNFDCYVMPYHSFHPAHAHTFGYGASDLSRANSSASGGSVSRRSSFHDLTKPAWDMETLKAGVRCAKTGSGEVKDFIQKCTFRPREQAFTTLINMCGRLRDWAKALEVFEAMKELKTVRPNTYTYSALISACSCAGEWQRALSVFDAMKVAAESDPGCRPNHVTYCALVTACERCGQHKAALELFDEMMHANITPDRVTWIAALSAADKIEDWDKVEVLLGQMHERGMAGTLAVYCGLLYHYAEQARWKEALDNFLIMQELGLSVDEHACVALMSALSAGGQWEMCLQLLESMYESHIIIDLFTYNLALAALAANDRWSESLDVLANIERMGLKPNEDTIKNVIHSCKATGHKEEASEVLERYDFDFSKTCSTETNSSSEDTNYDVAGQTIHKQ